MNNIGIRISVIIPTYNSARYLAKTLSTVAKQDYQPYEIIIVDGDSTDGTRDIVRAFGSLITLFISEPDKGQLDAVQKGILHATGDVLYWLNSDDAVMPGTFRTVAEEFSKDPTIEYLFGDNYWFQEETKRFGVTHSVKRLSFWDQFLFYGQLQVEAFFWRRELSQKALPFDTSLRVCTDYSVFLPLRFGAKGKWIHKRIGAFRVHADQMSSLHSSIISAEMTLVKQRMCERLGLTRRDYEILQRKNRIRFIIFHKLLVKIVSGFRFIFRKLTMDYGRKKKSQFFFLEWLQVPPAINSLINNNLKTQNIK